VDEEEKAGGVIKGGAKGGGQKDTVRGKEDSEMVSVASSEGVR